MMFSRDAVQAKLRDLNESASERARAFLLAAYAMCGLGIAFFIATLFTSKHWGGSVSFQALSTSILHLGMAAALQEWLKKPNTQVMDVLGGAYVVVLLMLLQTGLLWSNLSSGFAAPYGPVPCYLNGNGGDSAVSTLSYILFFFDVVFGVAAFKFRSDWTGGAGSSAHYVTIYTPGAQVDALPAAEARAQKSRTVQEFDDVEGGL
jgi:hypothetical protein